MIIKFSKDIELSEWIKDISPSYKTVGFYRAYKRQDGIEVAGVSVREYSWAKSIDPSFAYKCFAMFHHDLLVYDQIFPRDIEGDLDFAKDFVDKFLIKMAGLRAFV